MPEREKKLGIPIDADAVRRWRIELDLGIEFRDKEFGTYEQQQPGASVKATLAGKNLEYFEQGARSEKGPPLNIVFPIVKNVVPTLLYQNPKTTATPEYRTDTASEDAFYVSELMNRDLRDTVLRIKDTARQGVFDGYVLASGIVKLGYATRFGADILPTKREKKARLRDKLKEKVEDIQVGLGLKEPKEQELEPEKVQDEESIRAESPYIGYVSPFDFVIDPRARDIYDARWVAQRIRRTIKEIKEDRRYGPAKMELRPESLDNDRIPESEVEAFSACDVWEIHYKDDGSPTGVTILTLAATQEQTEPLMHDHNVYDVAGWQYEWLRMNKHGHRLYPISVVSVIRPLVDRINTSLDAVLEQLDKFQAKFAYNDRVSPDGEIALDSSKLGARIKCTGDDDVNGAIRVVAMEQVKADILGLINQVVDFVILITGLTRAQLTGLTTAQTATEAQIGQSGQNLRRTDESNEVSDWFNRVLTKYWRIKSQFQDLTDIDLVKEPAIPDPNTGMSTLDWYPEITPKIEERIKENRFRLHFEASSMQKPNLEVIRAQFEGFMTRLMQPIVTQGLALEGNRVSATEAVRQWSRFFIEAGLPGLEKLIVPINDPVQREALLNYGQEPEQVNGNGVSQTPNRANLISAAAGEKGQGASPA